MAEKGLSADERSYYQRVEGVLEGGEGLFLHNVVKQIVSDGAVRVCCDKEVSRVMERLLHHVALAHEDRQTLVKELTDKYSQLALHRNGSHVAECVVRLLAGSDQLLSIATSVAAQLSDYIVHPYGCHVTSCLLQILAGVQVEESIVRSTYSREFRKAKMPDVMKVGPSSTPPDSHLQLLGKFGRRVCKMTEFEHLLNHKNASPVLQVLLRLLSQQCPQRAHKMAKKILRCSDVPVAHGNSLPAIFSSTVGSHLMECWISVAGPQLCVALYQNCFKGHVMSFALHPMANYTLQQIIMIITPDKVDELMSELQPLEDVLFVGHSGVVVKLVERVAASCPDLQSILLERLLEVFHTHNSPRSCVPLFLSLTAYETYQEQSPDQFAVTVAGSLLVQSLLKFQNPKLVVSSLLRMTSDDIIKVSCDPSGCHVLESFMTSQQVPLKRKSRMLEKLQPHIAHLCTDKHGSRVVDSVWRNCDIGQKETIVQELLAHEEKLSEDFYGQIVLRNCNVTHFKRKQAAWSTQERGVVKRREMFRDILEEETSVRKKQKLT